MRRAALVVLAAAISAAGVGGCTEPPPPDPAPVPARYRALAAPPPGHSPEARARGERLFRENCLPCHGAAGHGDGLASRGLDPPPADLADPAFLAERSDGYLLWRISEGKPGTAMPGFGDVLSLEDRLALVAHLRRE